MRDRDLAFDTLAEVTDAVPEIEGGAIAKALSVIRVLCERDGIPPEDVPVEIERRAGYYRETWPDLTITPMALAKHWKRIVPKHKESPVEKLRKRFGT